MKKVFALTLFFLFPFVSTGAQTLLPNPTPAPKEPVIILDKTPSPIDDLIDDAQAFEDKQTAGKQTAEQKPAPQEQVIAVSTDAARGEVSSETAKSPEKEKDNFKVEIKPVKPSEQKTPKPAPKPAAAKKIKKTSQDLPSPSVLRKSIDGQKITSEEEKSFSQQEEYGQTPQYPHSWIRFYFGIVYLAVLIFFVYFLAKRSQDFSDDKICKP